MIKVKKANRAGYTAGCWEITKAQAKELCGGTLPKCGYERCIKKEKGYVKNEKGDREFPTTFTAWVENQSDAVFILRDENHIVEVKEV